MACSAGTPLIAMIRPRKKGTLCSSPAPLTSDTSWLKDGNCSDWISMKKNAGACSGMLSLDLSGHIALDQSDSHQYGES